MKTTLLLLCSLCTPLSTASALTWTVADDGTTTLYAQGAGDGNKHTIHNNGLDTSVTPTAYDSAGNWSSDATIGVGNDVVLRVPLSGALKVLDMTDEDILGASGTFN